MKRVLHPGLLASAFLVSFVCPARAATYSLADDFSCSDNRAASTWSYRLDDFASHPSAFPLLTFTNRDVNALWGSSFPNPPMMWSEARAIGALAGLALTWS
jgi:hypothetical protein